MSRAFVAASTQYLLKASAVVTAAPCTFAAWVNLASNPGAGGEYGVIAVQNNTGNNFINLDIYQDGAQITVHGYYYQDGTHFMDREIVASPGLGNWFHAASVFTSTSAMQVFYNGLGDDGTIVRNVGLPAVPAGVNETTIGIVDYSSGSPVLWPMNGSIAHAAIWNVALTQAEITSLAAGLAPSWVRPTNLLSYARLAGLVSPEPDEMSGTGYTVTGATLDTSNPVIYHLAVLDPVLFGSAL